MVLTKTLIKRLIHATSNFPTTPSQQKMNTMFKNNRSNALITCYTHAHEIHGKLHTFAVSLQVNLVEQHLYNLENDKFIHTLEGKLE